jgi:hypothetical protein
MPDCQDKFCVLRGESCDQRFAWLEKNLVLQLTANERAIGLAKDDLERRLEGMNRFREELQHQAATFLPRAYFEVEHKYLQKQIEDLVQWKSRSEGRASWSNLVAIVALGASIMFGVLHLLTK